MDDLDNHPGYRGSFTRNRAIGALENGIRVRKATFQSGDSMAIGSLGTILGSIGNREIGYMYFIEWDLAPKVACGTTDYKIVPD